MRRSVLVAATFVTLTQFAALRSQPATPSRLLEYSDLRPIVEMLTSGESRVHVWRIVFSAPPEFGGKTQAEVVEDSNPVIVIARVVSKAPEFMQFRNGFDSALVPMNAATWTGSG